MSPASMMTVRSPDPACVAAANEGGAVHHISEKHTSSLSRQTNSDCACLTSLFSTILACRRAHTGGGRTAGLCQSLREDMQHAKHDHRLHAILRQLTVPHSTSAPQLACTTSHELLRGALLLNTAPSSLAAAFVLRALVPLAPKALTLATAQSMTAAATEALASMMRSQQRG
jgi:hypothetical protein